MVRISRKLKCSRADHSFGSLRDEFCLVECSVKCWRQKTCPSPPPTPSSGYFEESHIVEGKRCQCFSHPDSSLPPSLPHLLPVSKSKIGNLFLPVYRSLYIYLNLICVYMCIIKSDFVFSSPPGCTPHHPPSVTVHRSGGVCDIDHRGRFLLLRQLLHPILKCSYPHRGKEKAGEMGRPTNPLPCTPNLYDTRGQFMGWDGKISIHSFKIIRSLHLLFGFQCISDLHSL